jgi:hypothetical protein
VAATPESFYASVVFLKLQDFVRRPVSEQTRLRAQLEAVVAVTAAGLATEDRLVLEAADGTAVVVLGNPRGALKLAESALLGTAAGLPLCVGLNHGAVLAKDHGIAGDAVAVAASIAQFAQAGQLLATRAFKEALADAKPGVEAVLVPKGTKKDAGLRSYEVFATDAGAPRRRDLRYLAASALVMLALIGSSVAWRMSVEGEQQFTDRVTASVRAAADRAGTWLKKFAGL